MDGIAYRYNQLSSRFPRLKRWLLTAIAVMVAICLGLVVYFVWFANRKSDEEKQEMISVKVKKAVLEDYIDKYTVMGTIKGAIENDMRFEMDGQLAAYNYKEGSKIKMGEVICSLDPKDALT